MYNDRVVRSPFSQTEPRLCFQYGTSCLYQCEETGFLFAWPTPTARTLAEYYTGPYHQHDRYANQTTAYNPWPRRLKTIESHRLTRDNVPTVLDIGAGTGAFLAFASRAGWNVSGVEASHNACIEIRRRVPSIDSLKSLFRPENYRDQSFDLITLWAVLEHMPYEATFLCHLHRLLKPGGILALSLPNPNTPNRYLFGRNWRYFIPTEHLSFYPPSLLRRLINHAGLTVCEEHSTFSGDAFNDGWKTSPLNALPCLVRKTAGRLVALLTPRVFHGDTLEFVCRKT